MLLTFYNEQIKTLISDGAFEPLLYLVTSNNINYTIVILYSIELNNWDIFIYFFSNFGLYETHYKWILTHAVKFNRMNIIEHLVTYRDYGYEWGLVYGSHINTSFIDYFLNLGCIGYNETMVYLIKNNNLTNLIYLDNKLGNGVLNYNLGLSLSTTTEFIDFFTNKGAITNGDIGENLYKCVYCDGLEEAALENLPEVVKFFVENGSENLNGALYNSARNENRELMDYLIDLGANNLDNCLAVGVKVNSLKVVNYCLDNGVTNIHTGLLTCIDTENITMLDYLLGLGLTVNYSELIEYANNLELADIVKHLIEWQN
jgi:hypothetical protein